MPGRNPRIIEAAQHLQPGEDAIDPVKFAARRLGIEVGAHHHRRQAGIRPFPAGKDIAHLVQLDTASGRAAP